MKNKINVYFIALQYVMLLSLILYLFHKLSDPLLFDSIDTTQNITKTTINNEQHNLDNEQPYVPVVLTKFDRLKRRILWHWFGDSREKFNTYEEFKQHWDPSFSIKNIIKSEWKEFRHNPCDFIKKQSTLIDNRNRKYMEYFESRYRRK
jgi:hypothetical protein